MEREGAKKLRDQCAMLDALCRALERANDSFGLADWHRAQAILHKMNILQELDESRKQHLVATQRNVELTGELNAANAALQQYVTSYQTYVGRIKEADRTLAQMENQRRAEDAKNCLQWWHCSSTMTIFLAIP